MKLVDGDPVTVIDDSRAVCATIISRRVQFAVVGLMRAELLPCAAVANNPSIRVCFPETEGTWWARGHVPETAVALEAANKLVQSL